MLNILRDRSIDQQRFGVIDARLNLQNAELEVLLTKIGVQEQALVAYWNWEARGRQLRVYEELLELALVRQDGLENEVEQGANERREPDFQHTSKTTSCCSRGKFHGSSSIRSVSYPCRHADCAYGFARRDSGPGF